MANSIFYSRFCGYPAKKSPAATMMNMALDRMHAAQPMSKSNATREHANKLGRLIHKKDAEEVGDEREDDVDLEHGLWWRCLPQT